jgi:ANTAR domain/GAF domain
VADGDRIVLNTFVEFTDVLVTGAGDLDSYLRWLTLRAAELLRVRAVTVLLAGEDDVLDVAASSGELADLLGRYEVALLEGPAVDAYRSRTPVECRELSMATARWSRFVPIALNAGLVAAHALPCQRRDEVLGTVAMYRTHTPASRVDHQLCRAVANAVSLGITAHREPELAVRAEQLQHALHSRIVIEQAKGMLAERANISIDQAFHVLRRHARNNNVNLHDVARQLLTGTLLLP